MDELVDILDEQGNFTGQTCLKSQAHLHGYFHPTVHVWLYNTMGQVLIQQREVDKETHPSLWDVSVAGHIGAGEPILEAAIRETQEEVGLNITTKDLTKIGVFKSVHQHSEHLLDKEFHHTFLCELKVPLHQLKKQASEVAALALIPLTKFAEETWGMANPQKYVPHNAVYYKVITKAIKEQL